MPFPKTFPSTNPTPLFRVRMSAAAAAAVSRVLTSGFIGQGAVVDRFELALAPHVGRRTVLAVNSCTSAIQLALRLSGVVAGDEVITTPMTCTATNEPVLAVGARVVWADIDPWTGNIDPVDVRKKVTRRTKAVMAVHWGGLPCDLKELADICCEYGIKLIEDAAHALGAVYNGKPIGSHGDFVCFSFQAIKHVTTGDGGLLSCKDRGDYERGKLLRWYGIRRPADLTKDIREWGYKFHMNDVSAAIGLENLKGLGADLRKRRANAGVYADTLKGRVWNPDSAFWFMGLHRQDRGRFIKHLAGYGIASGVVHERNDRYSMFKPFRAYLPGVDAFCRTQVNIPVGAWVDVERVVRACAGFR